MSVKGYFFVRELIMRRLPENLSHADRPCRCWCDTCVMRHVCDAHGVRGCSRDLCDVMTVPFSHLAPAQPVKQWHRKSPFLSSQRTVPLGLQGDGEHWSGMSAEETEKEAGRRPSSWESTGENSEGILTLKVIHLYIPENTTSQNWGYSLQRTLFIFTTSNRKL